MIDRIKAYARESKAPNRLEVLAAYMIIVLTFVVLLHFVESSVDSAKRQAAVNGRKVDTLAFNANVAEQKICTSTHLENCSALFDRLAKSLTQAQRHRLACDVLAALNRLYVGPIRKASHCPRPIKSP